MAVDLCETDFPYQKSGDWVLYESGTLSSNTQFTPEPVNFYVKIVLKNNNLVTGPKTVSLTLIKSESSKGDRRDDFLKLPIKDFVDRYEPFEVYLQWFDNGEGEYSAIRSGTTYEIYRAKRERKAKGWFD